MATKEKDIALGLKGIELKKKGYSLRERANELNTNKDTLRKAENLAEEQNQPQKKVALAGIEDEPAEEIGFLGRTPDQPTRQAPPAITDLALQRQLVQIEQDKVELEGRKVAALEKDVEIRSQLADLKQQAQDLLDEQEITKRLRPGRKLVAKYLKLLRELLDSCQDMEWDREDVEDLVVELEKLLDKVTEQAALLDLDESELAIYQGIDKLIDFLSDLLDEQEGSIIEFDLTNREREKFEALHVNAFEETVGSDSDDDADQDAQAEQFVEQTNAFLERVSDAIEQEQFWKEKEVKSFLNNVQECIENVTELAKSMDLEPEELQIIETLEMIEQQLEDCLQNYADAQSSRRAEETYYEDYTQHQAKKKVKLFLEEDLELEEGELVESYQIGDFADEISEDDDQNDDE